MSIKYYHTQENRGEELREPIKCTRGDAWLGEAYYFWEDEMDAVFWGKNSKRDNYHIYSATLGEEVELFDTVFNREHYEFWVRSVEKFCKKSLKKRYLKPTLKEINTYFLEKGIFKGVDAVLFQDISKNPDKYLAKDMQYKKRIQLALYNLSKLVNFKIHYEN